MDIEKLLDKHDENEEHHEEWELFRRSYVGGQEYREGEYLIKHAMETNTAFRNRVKQAMFVNYCAPIVDIYTAYLFKERPSRDIAGMDGEAFKQFLFNADLEGRSYGKLMRELSRWASVFGHMGVIVDKPVSDGAKSRAEELAFGVRPYISYYKPSAIINWGWELNYSGPPVLAFLVLREPELKEDVDLYRIWYKDRWELWEKNEVDGQPDETTLVDSGENPLGEIPFVLVRNRDSLDRMVGVSDIADVAAINKRIYYYDSDALEIIERTA